MTIAVCCVVPEGVVLGADSLATLATPIGDRYLQNEQKIFEVGQDSTIGMTTWGLGSFGDVSYRTAIAQFAEELLSTQVTSMADVATRWASMAWPLYEGKVINGIAASDLSSIDSASLIEESKVDLVQNAYNAFAAGFCIGGHCADRVPGLYKVQFHPFLVSPPEPVSIDRFDLFGAPDIGSRLIGKNLALANDIFESNKWTGAKEELLSLFAKHAPPLYFPVPIREAIDFVYSLVFATIKVMKFTLRPAVCGGKIEIAVITTDRKFRWVHHKGMGDAIE